APPGVMPGHRVQRKVVGMRSWRTWRVAMAFLLVLPLAGACKKKAPRPGEGAGAGAAGLGEEGLTGTGSSLERAKRGLGPEENGILTDVHFGYDSYELDAAGRDVLARNLEWLRQNARAKVELEGHCDSRGTIEYNLALGAKRAKAVKDYLVGQGIPAERVSTISYGKEPPRCPEENDACRARNRRARSASLRQWARPPRARP